MRQRVVLVSMLFVLSGLLSGAHAAEVTTYGAGLASCEAYLSSRDQQGAEEIAFNDWVAGYMSAVNAMANHDRNNLLGVSDLKAALYRLSDLCRARPDSPFAQAAASLLMLTTSSTGIHTVGAVMYGSGLRSCERFTEARDSEGPDEREFTDWLGGYFSGVNVASLTTDNALGAWELTDALRWLDSYCSAHPLLSFSEAVVAVTAARSHEAP